MLLSLGEQEAIVGFLDFVDEGDTGGAGAFHGGLHIELRQLEVVPGGRGHEREAEVETGGNVVACTHFNFGGLSAHRHHHGLFLDGALVASCAGEGGEEGGDLLLFVIFFCLDGAVGNFYRRVFGEGNLDGLLQTDMDGILCRGGKIQEKCCRKCQKDS